MHPRNRHKEYLDYRDLAERQPSLKRFVFVNPYGGASIDYKDEEALQELTRCLLCEFYQIEGWKIPAGYLCPPVPQRVDYIHILADLLQVPVGDTEEMTPARGIGIRGLDIGTGASCIYCLLGAREYGWSFVGSDVDAGALKNARSIVRRNGLADQIELRLQENRRRALSGVLQPGEVLAFCVCNPPFHESLERARQAAASKWQRMGYLRRGEDKNYQGTASELCCDGGEVGFVSRLAEESAEPQWRSSCLWFSSLLSRESSLEPVRTRLAELGAKRRSFELKQGKMVKWVLAWTFVPRGERVARLVAMTDSPATASSGPTPTPASRSEGALPRSDKSGQRRRRTDVAGGLTAAGDAESGTEVVLEDSSMQPEESTVKKKKMLCG